jgi:quercetin dioxygenase-like cupin family protein
MLSRRGFASCALCAITGFIATEASAQGSPPAASGGVTRKIISKSEGPGGYEILLVEAEIEAGVSVGRHTHPGVESAFVLEGGFELPIQGMEPRC